MKNYVERGGKTFSVSVSYNKGGMNMWTGKEMERGYYLNIRPVVLEKCDGYTSESFMIGAGYNKFLLGVKRQSSKSLDLAVVESGQWVDQIIDKILSEVD